MVANRAFFQKTDLFNVEYWLGVYKSFQSYLYEVQYYIGTGTNIPEKRRLKDLVVTLQKTVQNKMDW